MKNDAISNLRIGEFLVSIDAIKRWQVNIILSMQRNGDNRLFGQIAVEKNYIDDFALRKYMDYRVIPANLIAPDAFEKLRPDKFE